MAGNQAKHSKQAKGKNPPRLISVLQFTATFGWSFFCGVELQYSSIHRGVELQKKYLRHSSIPLIMGALSFLMLLMRKADTSKPIGLIPQKGVKTTKYVRIILGGFFFCMHSDLIGAKHDQFLAKRQGKWFEGSSKEDNTHRGVRSGIRRKTDAINDRLFAGSPTDRNGVDRDRRAAKYLIMVLGAVFTSDQSLTNTIKDAKVVGKALRVARAIWLQEAYRRKEAGIVQSIDDMYEAHYAEGLRRISLLQGAPSEVKDFDTAIVAFVTVMSDHASVWERAQWTPEDHDRAARTGIFPRYFENDQFEGVLPERKQRTNQSIDSIESLIYSVKGIIKSTIKEKAYKYGWKTCKRVMAMCLQAVEKKTLAGLMNAQRYLKNFLAGKTNFGTRKAVGKAPKVIMSDNEVNLLHGAVRAKQDFLGMPFDLAIFRIKTS